MNTGRLTEGQISKITEECRSVSKDVEYDAQDDSGREKVNTFQSQQQLNPVKSNLNFVGEPSVHRISLLVKAGMIVIVSGMMILVSCMQYIKEAVISTMNDTLQTSS